MYLKKKILLLGDGAVGKTSLIGRFVVDKYDDKYLMTLGTKVTKKDLQIKSKKTGETVDITLMIWDILGQKQFRKIQASAYQGAKGALIVSDITRKETLNSMREWRKSLYDVAGPVPVVFLANKSDLVDNYEFTEEDLKEICEKLKASYLLTSALSGLNVDKAFKRIARLIVKKGKKI